MRPTCAYCGETLRRGNDTGYCGDECIEADVERDRQFDEVRFDTLEEAAAEGEDYSIYFEGSGW